MKIVYQVLSLVVVVLVGYAANTLGGNSGFLSPFRRESRQTHTVSPDKTEQQRNYVIGHRRVRSGEERPQTNDRDSHEEPPHFL